MKVFVIINPVAGARLRQGRLKTLLTLLEKHGYRPHRLTTEGAGDAQRFARQAADEKAHAVIVVGGDGTIAEVANGLNGSHVPVIFWPAGTENLCAKAFSFKADPHQTLACLQANTPKPLDLGIANGRAFLILAGVGFDGQVIRRLHRVRTGHITHLSYFMPIWRTFWEYRFPTIRVSSEGQPVWTGRGLVFVANMRDYSVGLNVVKDAVFNDGQLDLCIFRCKNRWELIGHAVRTLLRTQLKHRSVVYRRVTDVHVEADVPVAVQLDGDELGDLPMDVTIHPQAIRVMVPPDRKRR